MNELYILAALVVAGPVLIIVSTYSLVVKMSTPENMMRIVPAGGLSPQNEATVQQHTAWLASQGYQHIMNFQFSSIQVAVFQQVNAPRFFSLNFHQTTTYDLVTMFDNESSLTTGTSKSIGMFPVPPGTYKQGFPDIAADVALRRHLESETYLVQKFGINWQAMTKSYDQVVLDGIRRQMAFVRAIPLWPLRVLPWYFITRKKMTNLSVQQQYP